MILGDSCLEVDFVGNNIDPLSGVRLRIVHWLVDRLGSVCLFGKLRACFVVGCTSGWSLVGDKV